MDKQAILHKLFPSLNAQIDSRCSEVNGLEQGTVPQNCTIVARGLSAAHENGRQEHFLVQVDDALVYTRVCTAHPDSDYAEYAVVHGIAVDEAAKTALAERAHNFIDRCCKK